MVPLLEWDSELDELARLVAEAETEHQSSCGERVGQAHVFGQSQWLVERQHDRLPAQPNSGGGLSHVGDEQQWRCGDRVVGEVVLGKPGDVEVELLGELHLGAGLCQQLGGVARAATTGWSS